MGQVFIYFHQHTHLSARQRQQNVVVHDFSGISQSCPNILYGQLRICLQNFVSAQSISQAADDHSYRDARPLYARLAVMDIGCHDDPFSPICTPFHELGRYLQAFS